MKRMINLLRVVAVAAVALTSCQNNFEEVTNEVVKGNVVVNFVAESTRTSVDTSGDAPIFSWSENETFAVLEQTDALAEATNVIYENVEGKASIKAELAANPDKGTYQYVVVYPETGYVSAESVSSAVLALPAEQNMAEESYDPTADLMVSKPVETTVQPTEAQYVQFTRLAAVAKMTIKNFTLAAGESVEKVEFTANGKTLAGRVTTDLTNPETLTVNQGVSTVSVATTSADVVYFTVLPTTLEAGDSYSVVILTNKHLYVKSGTIPAEKSLAFEAGVVTRFNVNMADVEPSEKWTLVRDASTLNAGDIVTIAAQNNNYVLGCNSTDNFPYASYTEFVKVGDYLYHPIITDKSKYQYMIQPLVLSKQDAESAAFDLYNGVDYEGDTKSGYLTSAQTNNYLKLSNYPSNDSAFVITIENGVAKIEATKTQWNNNLLKFFNYNPNSTTKTYRRFVCIDETKINTEKHDDVCIYKLEGKTSEVPVAGAVVTVPEEDEKVVIPVEGVAEATVLEDVKFTYVGDWTIAVSTDAQWLTLEYADGVLRYSAEANEGAVRYATVTISATHEGEEAKSWTVNVVQKGVPVKVTVAQFIEKAVDPNVEYEVTGILTKKATGSSYSTTIADAAGKVATFKYIDMENGSSFYTNESIKEGDIVTIVAAVSDEATGGSSSAHAICKGYYNISATAESDLVAYTGGSVTLNLSKKGTLNPGDITCTVNAAFAEVEYTTNADEATVTLEANEGAPRQVIATFTDGIATATVAIVQSADTSKGNTWELVTDASTLAAGDKVIIAAKDYDVALSTTISTSDRRSAVDITKLGNYYLTPAATAQTLILANGSVDGTFAFYDADNKGFLVSSSTSYYLKNQAYIDENTSFAISIADGVATIGNKTGDYNNNKIYYYQSSNYFYSGTSTKQPVCLYRLVGVKGTVPVIPADITVPTGTNKVVVPEEGTAVATPIDEVVFNYVGEWNIEATSEAEWINFEFNKANNRLTYTAQANESVVRETTATITATMDGQEPHTWSFNILQKGKPQEITIAEFINKPVDVNVTYKLTGIVTTLAENSTNKGYVLSDENGNTAKINYLQDEAGNAIWGHNDIKIQLGDVITVTTVVTSTATGGNSSNSSTFKGYYRLTATASTTLVGYEGGTVTFNLATEGNLLPAEAVISGAMAEEYDFVTFNHTAGATTATATFAANAGAPRDAEFNFTYGLATASVAIGQQNNPSVKVGWFLVTDASKLDVGDKVIIAAKSIDGKTNYAISTATSANSRPTTTITLIGNTITNVDGLQQYTLESGHTDYPNTWAFKGDSDSKYLYAASGYLRVNDSVNAGCSWDVAITSEGVATLTSQTSNSKNTIMFNDAQASKTITVYTPSQTGKGAIYIYKYYNE